LFQLLSLSGLFSFGRQFFGPLYDVVDVPFDLVSAIVVDHLEQLDQLHLSEDFGRDATEPCEQLPW
jgi:hypothetical protein